MTKRQTAVQFLIEHIKQDTFVHSKSTKEWNQVFAQAKQIEKEHIIDAVDYGCSDWGSGKDSEKYYNEEYGK